MKTTSSANETSVQSAVFSLDLGRGRHVVRWVLVVLLGITLSLMYSARTFRGLNKIEAQDMAQLARHIARGEGYTTYVIRPLSLWQLEKNQKCLDATTREPRIDKHPDLWNPPLYPWMLSSFFRLTPQKAFEMTPEQLERVAPAERWVILPFSQICLLLCVLLAYFWARQLFDKQVAVTVGLLLLFSDMLWSYSITGLPTNFLMLLWMLALYCLFQADRVLNPPAPAEGVEQSTAAIKTGRAIALTLVGGVLLGLCFLTRYSMALLAIPLAVYVWRIWSGRKAALWAVLYLAVFLAVIAPWLIHNVNVSGSPLGIAQYQWRGGEVLQRNLKTPAESFLAWTSMTSAALRGLRETAFGGFKSMSGDFFVFFFSVGLLYGFRSRENNRLRTATFAGLVFAILAMAIFGTATERVEPQINGNNLLVLFLPLVAIFGVAFFYLLLDRIPFRMQLTRGIVIGLFAFVNVLPFVLTFLPPKKAEGQYPPYSAQLTQAIAKLFTADEVGVSDHPWSMAWMGDRRTVLLPLTVEDYIFINDHVAPHNMQFLLFTPHMTDRPFESDLMTGDYRSWLPVVLGSVPKLFPLTAQVRLMTNRPQLLMADRDRWSAKPIEKPATPPPAQNTNTTTTGTP